MPASKEDIQELKEALNAHRLLKDFCSLYPAFKKTDDGTRATDGATEAERQECLKALNAKIQELIKKIKTT